MQPAADDKDHAQEELQAELPVGELVVDSTAEASGLETEPAVVEVMAELPPPMTPGRQLREARIAKRLSVDDVADILRFSPRQITILEEDRYDELPGATLVRGFIRSYAKLLKLDPLPLLAALTPAVPPTAAEVRPPQNIGVAEDAEASDRGIGKSVPWASIAATVVILAIVGLIAFFLTTSGSIGESSSATEASSGPTQGNAPTGGVLPPTVTVAGAQSSDSAAGDPTQPPPPTLVAEFDDRSWIEVRDAAQKVVFVGEYPKGTRQAITGKAPFQIWIGRASVVRLTYGERTVDLKPHSREDVARLVLE
jgi:cytoskeleton protein RodZ